MFDFDVITGPTPPHRPAPPSAPEGLPRGEAPEALPKGGRPHEDVRPTGDGVRADA